MKQAFIIMAQVGSYDDLECYPVAVSMLKDKAELLAKEFTQTQANQIEAHGLHIGQEKKSYYVEAVEFIDNI